MQTAHHIGRNRDHSHTVGIIRLMMQRDETRCHRTDLHQTVSTSARGRRRIKVRFNTGQRIDKRRVHAETMVGAKARHWKYRCGRIRMAFPVHDQRRQLLGQILETRGLCNELKRTRAGTVCGNFRPYTPYQGFSTRTLSDLKKCEKLTPLRKCSNSLDINFAENRNRIMQSDFDGAIWQAGMAFPSQIKRLSRQHPIESFVMVCCTVQPGHICRHSMATRFCTCSPESGSGMKLL